MVSISRRSLAYLALFATLVFPVVPLKAASTDPKALVDGLVRQALALIRNNQLSDSARNQQFKILLGQNFDIPRISRFVLGRYWTAANANDLKAFNDLFEQWVVRIYSSRFKEYNGETVTVTDARPESDTSFVVQSQLIHPDGSPPTQVDWHVSKKDNGFKILDVEVEGVSMALTERDEFASIIARNGGSVASLNQAMQQKLASSD
jgi:phospholipid transport system substrate-binding protein